MQPMPDYYAVLQVKPSDDAETIKKSYERLVMHYADRYAGNPDVQAHLNLLMDAYMTLTDPDKRQAYDQIRPKSVYRGAKTSFWQRLFGKKKQPANVISIQKAPTFTQLLDFDWDALEEKPVETPEKKKAFYDELKFKLVIILLFLILMVLVWRSV
jgi:DnaJ-class molecular chaperone